MKLLLILSLLFVSSCRDIGEPRKPPVRLCLDSCKEDYDCERVYRDEEYDERQACFTQRRECIRKCVSHGKLYEESALRSF